jgi:hypothetical protein
MDKPLPILNIYLYDDTYCENENEIIDRRGNSLASLLSAMFEARHLFFRKQVYSDTAPNCNCDSIFCSKECKECELYAGKKENGKITVVFIHTSNKCFYGFVKQLLNNNKYWIVCYSGGSIIDANAYNSLPEPKAKNVFFSVLPKSSTQETINKQWNIELFVRAIVEGYKSPFNYLENKGNPILSALSILCIGFLVQTKPDYCPKISHLTSSDFKNTSIWRSVLGLCQEDALQNLEQTTPEIDVLITRVYTEIFLDPSDINIVEKAYNSIPGCSS